MGRLWWTEVLAAGLAVASFLTFLLGPVVFRRRGIQGSNARRGMERAYQRVQVLLAAASVALLAIVLGGPLAARML